MRRDMARDAEVAPRFHPSLSLEERLRLDMHLFSLMLMKGMVSCLMY